VKVQFTPDKGGKSRVRRQGKKVLDVGNKGGQNRQLRMKGQGFKKRSTHGRSKNQVGQRRKSGGGKNGELKNRQKVQCPSKKQKKGKPSGAHHQRPGKPPKTGTLENRQRMRLRSLLPECLSQNLTVSGSGRGKGKGRGLKKLPQILEQKGPRTWST